MDYKAPLSQIMLTLNHAAGLQAGIASGVFSDLGDGLAEAVLEEAAKFGENVLAPINHAGDRTGAALADKVVTTAPGWRSAYQQWIDGGWNALTGPASHGGQGLPHLLNSACLEIWSAANMAFTLCPVLGMGAVEAVSAHGTDELKSIYLEKMVSGAWTGTMNLTEPQAGSDLALLRTRAERAGDGSYRIKGQKIFITYGEHDMAENIVHLVLARLPDAPAGTRGISLFLVPKFLVNADGSLGRRNDVFCSGLEEKMGIHASPTCTMIFGDQEGAIGWLIGEENRGLNCMFTMMNNARLATALQGVALADVATQKATHFAHERRQGRAPGDAGPGPAAIIRHPDVRRNLMIMRTMTGAARAICYLTAQALDHAHRAKDPQTRQEAGARAALLTPLAKAFSSDIGNEVTSLGVQVHGGMGFIEETGAAQYMRDARIVAIYEGTNGIQAIDLVQRKLGLANGATVAREIADMRATLALLGQRNTPGFGKTHERLTAAVDSFEQAAGWLHGALAAEPALALAGATPFLRLFGLARGGVSLAAMALAAANDAHEASATGDARFFAECLATAAPGLALSIMEGGTFALEPGFGGLQ
ncbi:MAG: acyl-CoA dehydrogenase family protein [Hyphomicrobiales bacterium]|nr:acyl-CoA dehydrogenase family protein [Hyphomicrobiales bacterium]